MFSLHSILTRSTSRISLIVLVMLLFGSVDPVWAHANLVRSDPPENGVVAQSPAEIRLWFTEPVEPEFSRFRLRDADGAVITTPDSVVDAADATQMWMSPGDLPDGLYTITWRVVSAADGHPTQGSFPFTVGAASGALSVASASSEAVPLDSAAVRWLNLISMAVAVGGIGFWLFVWNLAVPAGQPEAERRMRRVIWAGWIALGVTGVLVLLLQVSVAADVALLDAPGSPALGQVITATRFGDLWLGRMGAWLGLGVILLFAQTDRRFYWAGLLLGGLILATNSLFSHASSSADSTLGIAADWLHLVAMTLWIGGLVQFLIVMGPVRRYAAPPTAMLATLVASFSNFARVSVAALIITGLYATWLQVGSLEALLTTTYGQALLVKLILMIPLLSIGAINLVLTHRGLQAGQMVWTTRLRGLVGTEITLGAIVLAAVGFMTAGAPARGVVDVRAAAAAIPPPNPIVLEDTVNDLQVHFEASPGWVGDNQFTIRLVDGSDAPVDDATLIRMRFTNLSEDLGESELRPEHQADGNYTIEGSNLSVPGQWRVRTTIQRPGKYDSLADFSFEMSLPPAVSAAPLAAGAALPFRAWVLLLTGVAALAVGGFFLGERRSRFLTGSAVLALALLAIGAVFLLTGVLTL